MLSLFKETLRVHTCRFSFLFCNLRTRQESYLLFLKQAVQPANTSINQLFVINKYKKNLIVLLLYYLRICSHSLRLKLASNRLIIQF